MGTQNKIAKLIQNDINGYHEHLDTPPPPTEVVVQIGLSIEGGVGVGRHLSSDIVKVVSGCFSQSTPSHREEILVIYHLPFNSDQRYYYIQNTKMVNLDRLKSENVGQDQPLSPSLCQLSVDNANGSYQFTPLPSHTSHISLNLYI